MKLFRIWDDCSQVETEKFFFDESNAVWYINRQKYPKNWAMDSVETYDDLVEE